MPVILVFKTAHGRVNNQEIFSLWKTIYILEGLSLMKNELLVDISLSLFGLSFPSHSHLSYFDAASNQLDQPISQYATHTEPRIQDSEAKLETFSSISFFFLSVVTRKKNTLHWLKGFLTMFFAKSSYKSHPYHAFSSYAA